MLKILKKLQQLVYRNEIILSAFRTKGKSISDNTTKVKQTSGPI
jgi:hypothetical protein